MIKNVTDFISVFLNIPPILCIPASFYSRKHRLPPISRELLARIEAIESEQHIKLVTLHIQVKGSGHQTNIALRQGKTLAQLIGFWQGALGASSL